MTDNSLALSNYAYNSSTELPTGYTLDSELSNDKVKVALDSQGTPHIAFRGTKTIEDVFPDFDIALGLRSHQRFRDAVDLAKRVESKHGKEAVVTGHSLGGNLAQHVSESLGGRRGKVFNPGKSLFGNPSESTQKLVVERHPLDPVSSGIKLDTGNLRMSIVSNLAKLAMFHGLDNFRK